MRWFEGVGGGSKLENLTIYKMVFFSVPSLQPVDNEPLEQPAAGQASSPAPQKKKKKGVDVFTAGGDPVTAGTSC